MVINKWFVVGLVVGAVLVLGLGGCNGYPRFDPATCWAVEYSGEVPLWQCA